MYSPPYNRVDDRAELVEFMRGHNFVLLVTARGGALQGSHLPALVEERSGTIVLELHMARSNRQWRDFGGEEVMVVFSGPHAYVSPRWYEEKPRVPTWNYAAVHAYGVPKIIHEQELKQASQRRLVASLDREWLPKFDELPQDYVSSMLNGIVNFEIAVSRIETRWKLSQNRGRREQELIAAALGKSEDSVERSLAALTLRHLAQK